MWELWHAQAVTLKILRGNNYERKKARFVSHACDMSTHPDLQPNQMLLKNLQGQGSYGAHKNESSDELTQC